MSSRLHITASGGLIRLDNHEEDNMEPKVCRAKFTCQGVTKRRHWDAAKGFLYDAEFTPVTDGSAEDKAFWEATPAGSLKLSTIREGYFEPGKTYYLDFIEAPSA